MINFLEEQIHNRCHFVRTLLAGPTLLAWGLIISTRVLNATTFSVQKIYSDVYLTIECTFEMLNMKCWIWFCLQSEGFDWDTLHRMYSLGCLYWIITSGDSRWVSHVSVVQVSYLGYFIFFVFLFFLWQETDAKQLATFFFSSPGEWWHRHYATSIIELDPHISKKKKY